MADLFNPIFARPGQYVRLQEMDKPPSYYYIVHAEVLSSYVVGQNSNNSIDTFGTVSAGDSVGPIEISDLEPNNRHLYQLVVGFATPVTFYRWISNTFFMGGVDERKAKTTNFREIAYWNQFMSPFHNPSLRTMMWVSKSYVPGLEVYNHTRRSWKPQARYTGWMFDVVKLDPNDSKDAEIINKIDNGIIPAHIYSFGGIPGKGT